ncbi:helix-turn-helix transcriptional regulator [Vibrio sp. RE86]|uniref:helix-turn-helix domain-containing protein n=1 Tax=Vibrio sp. RE86 TaxID=2607605 RepID=UPI0014933580|nr:helix-turn-helix transcriptional regulator [Vibrio sp. RE86]NOH80203.1 helix-turn-helix transcriptional regulator [Vibrio sp. RE86]
MKGQFQNISHYILTRRNERKFVQEELADKLIDFNAEFHGIDGQIISRWERGKVSPSLFRQVLIIEFFGDNPYTLLSDQSFEVAALRTLATYEKLLKSNFTQPLKMGLHPYLNRGKSFLKKEVSSEEKVGLSKVIAEHIRYVSADNVLWESDNLLLLMRSPSTLVLKYMVDDVLAGHLILLRIKRDYLGPLLRYELPEPLLKPMHLAEEGDPASLYLLSLYSGTEEIHININTQIFSDIVSDVSIDAIGVQLQHDLGLKTMEIANGDFVATGKPLPKGSKVGVRYQGRKYESVGYQISREKLLASSLAINLSRADRTS